MFFTEQAAGDAFYTGFKFWAVMPITVLFSMLQTPLLSRYADTAANKASVASEAG